MSIADPNAFAGPWAAAEREGITCCHWCEHRFTATNPPTYDHIIPKAHGGTRDAFVLACRQCNNARGACPYEQYRAACDAEHARARATGHQYIRPRHVLTPEGWQITTLSRRARRNPRSTP